MRHLQTSKPNFFSGKFNCFNVFLLLLFSSIHLVEMWNVYFSIHARTYHSIDWSLKTGRTMIWFKQLQKNSFLSVESSTFAFKKKRGRKTFIIIKEMVRYEFQLLCFFQIFSRYMMNEKCEELKSRILFRPDWIGCFIDVIGSFTQQSSMICMKPVDKSYLFKWVSLGEIALRNWENKKYSKYKWELKTCALT